MTKLAAYLTFDGTCEAAFQHYRTLLGGTVAVFRYADLPAGDGCEMPAGWDEKVMHAEFVLDGARLMGTDAPPSHRQPMAGVSVSLHVDTPEEAERVFAGLSEGASITMPMQETFWSKRFGVLTDRFGTPWMINCEGAG